jgi:Mg2+ and Co2+ transporter CorA
MNKISESIIVTYAKALRRIQTEQVDPYIELIEKELIKLYPELKDREDNALNWAYDIINADSTAEVIETLDRIKQIFEEEYKEKWVCCICGKNTYDVDCEYLAGIDHLSCLTTEELKKSNPLKNKDEFHEIKNQFVNMKIYIKQLEEHIQRLEKQYDEPTN